MIRVVTESTLILTGAARVQEPVWCADTRCCGILERTGVSHSPQTAHRQVDRRGILTRSRVLRNTQRPHVRALAAGLPDSLRRVPPILHRPTPRRCAKAQLSRIAGP